MALQITKPYVHVEDGNGNPYVGAKLYVYTPETTTLAAVYTDDDLTDPASNPATSDAAGNFPRLYIAAGTYKLRAEKSNGGLIWEEDNIDTGLSAGTGALPINRGGTGATTAAAARSNLDVPSNSELTALASSIASLSSAIQSIVAQPQGYLTPTSGTPVITTGVTAGTSVFYTPDTGNLVPIYDGVQFNATQFPELTLTLNSNHVANGIYDCFIINDSSAGVLLVTGPVWNTVTAGSGARGTGAGTSELGRTNGVLTNANAMTARNGATTYSVAANRATFVGSIAIDGTAGQITCHRAWGQSRKWSISNCYNRRPVFLKAGDVTSTWTYGTGTYRPANNSTNNKLTFFNCLAEEQVELYYMQKATSTQSSASAIGFNSTTATSGRTIETFLNNCDAVAHYLAPPSLGLNVVTALEQVPSGTGSATFYGGSETNMLLEALWRA